LRPAIGARTTDIGCLVLQTEFSLTQVLDRPVTGRMFFEDVIRQNLDLGRPDQVQDGVQQVHQWLPGCARPVGDRRVDLHFPASLPSRRTRRLTGYSRLTAALAWEWLFRHRAMGKPHLQRIKAADTSSSRPAIAARFGNRSAFGA
jgi:hypothetical protein